jgi:hypothetical protein
MIFPTLASACDTTAQYAPQAASLSPTWLQVIQAIGSVATAVGVLIALYVALIREPKEASAEHRHHVAQMDALRSVKNERLWAQARKLVPSSARTPLLGDRWWTVRLDNASSAVTAILSVHVAAMDSNGVEVNNGCRQATSIMPLDKAFDESIRAALSESLESGLERPANDTVREAIRDALGVHFVNTWPGTLRPNQHVVMAYTTTDPSYELRITVEFEDEAGMRWRRTDAGHPRQVEMR